MGIRKQFKDPLVGFGWAGYLSTAILIVLVVILFARIEPRYELLKIMPSTIGVDAMMLFVTRLPFLGFSIFGVSVSVVTGAAFLVAFKVAPYRVHPLILLLIFLFCTSWFAVVSEGNIVINRLISGSSFFTFQLLEVFGIALIGTAVSCLSRSKLVVAMWVLAVSLALANAVWFNNTGNYLPGTIFLFYGFEMYAYTSLSLLFDLLTMGSLLLWAIFERRTIFPDHMCESCGYDLEGLSGGSDCPECGHQ